MENVVKAIKLEIYMTFIKQLNSQLLKLGRVKPLHKGTIHKYQLNESEVEFWEQNRATYLRLKEELVLKIKQLYSHFSGFRDVCQTKLQQYNNQMTKQF